MTVQITKFDKQISTSTFEQPFINVKDIITLPNNQYRNFISNLTLTAEHIQLIYATLQTVGTNH